MEYLKFTCGVSGLKVAYLRDTIVGVQQDLNSPTHSMLILSDGVERECVAVDEDFLTVFDMLNGKKVND